MTRLLTIMEEIAGAMSLDKKQTRKLASPYHWGKLYELAMRFLDRILEEIS